VPANVILRGEGSHKTALVFTSTTGGNCIDVTGKQDTTKPCFLTQKAYFGSRKITLNSVANFAPNNWIRLQKTNPWNTIPPTTWAQNSPGQIVQIDSVVGNSIILREPLMLNLFPNDSAQAQKLQMIENVGIENLRVTHNKSLVSGVSSNLCFNMATNCWMQGVESRKSYSAHVFVRQCAHLYFAGNYINTAFIYDGAGARGYGFLLFEQTTLCLVENNILRNLRHQISMKQGACGNVAAYNYTRETYRTEQIHDYAADFHFHGFMAQANLYEGNSGMFGSATNTWGPSGRYNTYFRNRMRGYGFVNAYVGFGTDTIQTDSLNVVANEITGTGFSGFVPMGQFSFAGKGHLLYANFVQGLINPAPQGAVSVPEKSFYRQTQPYWWTPDDPWGGIGYPNAYNTHKIPAERRWDTDDLLTVPVDTVTGASADCAAPVLYPLGQTTFPLGDSVTLVSSYANGNVWNTGDTTQSLVVKYTGIYYARYRHDSCLSHPSNLIQICSYPPQAKVSGVVASVSGMPLAGVEMIADSVSFMQTNPSGSWEKLLDSSKVYKVWPQITTDTAKYQGLSTYDVVLCNQFASATIPLHPYNQIAADVNNNNQVDIQDASEIRDFVLGLRTDFQGQNWRFISSSYRIKDPQNPWPYPNFRAFKKPANDLHNQNFIGIRLGDLNDSWNMPGPPLGTTSFALCRLQTQVFAAGTTIQIPIFAHKSDSIAGYQFSVSWDTTRLSWLGITQGPWGGVQTNITKIDKGLVGIQWDSPNPNGQNFADSLVLFKLNFDLSQPTTADSISIKLNGSFLQSEVIDKNGQLFYQPDTAVFCVIKQPLANIRHGLKQKPVVSPNPSAHEIHIRYQLDDAQKGTFKVQNAMGQPVVFNYVEANVGQNTLTWNPVDQHGNRLPVGFYSGQLTFADAQYTFSIIIE
jgi:hypothetical protein